MQIIIPDALKKGDTIGLISPSAGSAGVFPHRVKGGIAALERLGYRVKVAKNALNRSGYLSGTAAERVDDLHDMFRDSSVKAVMAMIGGNHSNQLLDLIDYDLLRANPKIFIGYSDNTVLHYALRSKAGLRTYYGPCLITEFGEFPEPLLYTSQSFKRTLGGDVVGQIQVSDRWTDEILDWTVKADLDRPRELKANTGLQWLKRGVSEGEFFGGCIPSINHLLGTEYWVDPKDKIFFLDIPEGSVFGEGMSISDVDTFLTDLKNAGLFESIKGLIVGRPYRYNPDQLLSLTALIRQFTAPYDYPVVLNADIGHTAPMVTIPLGAVVRIDSESSKIEVIEAGTIK